MISFILFCTSEKLLLYSTPSLISVKIPSTCSYSFDRSFKLVKSLSSSPISPMLFLNADFKPLVNWAICWSMDKSLSELITAMLEKISLNCFLKSEDSCFTADNSRFSASRFSFRLLISGSLLTARFACVVALSFWISTAFLRSLLTSVKAFM